MQLVTMEMMDPNSNLDDGEHKNSSNIQKSFKNESLNIKAGTKEAREFLTGSERFKTIELETFRVIPI